MKFLIITFLGVISFTLALSLSPKANSQQHQQLRNDMVTQQIERRGVTHPEVLRAMRTVPRHLFVPDAKRGRAYTDTPLPIGYGQTISQPFIVAYMTAIVEPDSTMRALEIGTGSGYHAAIIAEIVDKVYTIEIVEPLGLRSKKVYEELGLDNISTKIADGFYGWSEKAPFDIIVVTAASEHIPPPLIEQLKKGGKMIIPVGSPFMTQQLVLVEKDLDGKVTTRSLMPVRFVPFTRTKR